MTTPVISTLPMTTPVISTLPMTTPTYRYKMGCISYACCGQTYKAKLADSCTIVDDHHHKTFPSPLEWIKFLQEMYIPSRPKEPSPSLPRITLTAHEFIKQFSCNKAMATTKSSLPQLPDGSEDTEHRPDGSEDTEHRPDGSHYNAEHRPQRPMNLKRRPSLPPIAINQDRLDDSFPFGVSAYPLSVSFNCHSMVTKKLKVIYGWGNQPKKNDSSEGSPPISELQRLTTDEPLTPQSPVKTFYRRRSRGSDDTYDMFGTK